MGRWNVWVTRELFLSLLKHVLRLKNAVFWYVRNDVSEERIDSIVRVTRYCVVFLRSVLRLRVTTNVPSSPILVTLMMESMRPSESSVLTRTTRRNIPKDGILHSRRRENLKPYTF
jgi:hypothetical protein